MPCRASAADDSPGCCRKAQGTVDCPRFRRVSADRTSGGDDLWQMGFASGMGWPQRV